MMQSIQQKAELKKYIRDKVTVFKCDWVDRCDADGWPVPLTIHEMQENKIQAVRAINSIIQELRENTPGVEINISIEDGHFSKDTIDINLVM